MASGETSRARMIPSRSTRKLVGHASTRQIFPTGPPVPPSGRVIQSIRFAAANFRRTSTSRSVSMPTMSKGLPANRSLLAQDGTLYVLFEEKPFSVKDRVAGLADVPVIVKGTPVDRAGVKGIQIASIEKAGS